MYSTTSNAERRFASESGGLQGRLNDLLIALQERQERQHSAIPTFLLGVLCTLLVLSTAAFLAYAWYEEQQGKKQLKNAAEISDTLDARRLKEIVGEVGTP
jgi:hypothetical protein